MNNQDTIVRYTDVEIHRDDLIALKNVNFRLSAGEFVYLVGRVGSGKSSLLKSMYAEVPVVSGSAMVLGRDMTAIRPRDIPRLRRDLGIVFQDFQLLTDRSVHANLRFVLEATGWRDRDRIEERINQVLSQAGMLNKAYRMPHELSGGEQQRIVIARALLNSPKMVLADEPTGNLDPKTADEIVTHLHHIASQGTAVIMATHNLSFVERFPARVVHCDNRTLL